MWRAVLDTNIKKLSLSMILGIVCVVLSATAVIAYYRHTSNHLPPNIFVNEVAVGNLKFEEAVQLLTNHSPTPPSYAVTVSVDGISVASQSAELGLRYNYIDVLDEMKATARQGRLRDRVAWRMRPLFSAQHYDVSLSYDEQKVAALLEELNEKVMYEGEDPNVTLTVSNNPNTLKVFAGKSGRMVDSMATAQLLHQHISADTASVAAVVASTSAQLSEEEVVMAKARSEKFVGKSIKFKYENRDYSISDKEMVSLLKLPKGYETEEINTKIATIAAELNRSPQEPIFEYNKESLAVTKFLAPLNGQTLDESKTYTQLLEGLQKIDDSTALSDETQETEKPELPTYDLAVATTPPKQSLADTNDLGIKERIGFGDSHYDHSIPNRIHNVAITTERISDHIVPPGGEFSFNKTLGDVSAETGYRTAYVIKNGQTELGDGGGVCQVSTTLFRSVLNAGLKVTRRLPHSYRVSYYELDRKPGVDATVYTGNTDFRFINDTPGHILIHAEADSRDLYMTVNIYGTSDGRSTEIKDHITWNPRPAPAAQYFPDPTLPAGKLVQIDWAASGINSSFINVIKDKDGKVIREDKYVSNYRPWAAKYRQGTGT